MAIVHIRRVPNWDGNKIPFIKALRSADRSDLRTAKGVSDTLEHTDMEIEIPDASVATFLRDIRLLGLGVEAEIVVSEDIAPYRSELQSIASVAILSGDTGIAKDIINLLQRYERYEGTKS